MIMVLWGLWMASHRARIAVIVDLPDCLLQFRMILWDVDRRNSACQGSGSNLRLWIANITGSAFVLALIRSSAFWIASCFVEYSEEFGESGI